MRNPFVFIKKTIIALTHVIASFFHAMGKLNALMLECGRGMAKGWTIKSNMKEIWEKGGKALKEWSNRKNGAEGTFNVKERDEWRWK